MGTDEGGPTEVDVYPTELTVIAQPDLNENSYHLSSLQDGKRKRLMEERRVYYIQKSFPRLAQVSLH